MQSRSSMVQLNRQLNEIPARAERPKTRLTVVVGTFWCIRHFTGVTARMVAFGAKLVNSEERHRSLPSWERCLVDFHLLMGKDCWWSGKDRDARNLFHPPPPAPSKKRDSRESINKRFERIFFSQINFLLTNTIVRRRVDNFLSSSFFFYPTIISLKVLFFFFFFFFFLLFSELSSFQRTKSL